MRSLIAFGLVCGMTAPVWARPDGNNDRPPPPSMMRSEVQMRMPIDGRGDTASMMRESRPDPWQRAEKPQAERAPTSAQRADLPLKSDVAQKAHPGDSRDVQPKPQALDARMQNQKPADDRMGRPEQKPALPIKIEVAMKQQGGEIGEGGASGSAAKKSASGAVKMTAHDRDMLCRTAGVCLPASHATDDTEDKTE
ncbi:MAG TPA: hypothetical protein VGL86_18240 [Polyangia bacterium]|jgi:hypothetical protein